MIVHWSVVASSSLISPYLLSVSSSDSYSFPIDSLYYPDYSLSLYTLSFWPTLSMGSGAAKSAPPKPPPEPVETPAAETPQTDPRLPYPNFRELFTLKNYWKTVRRNDKDCSKKLLARYLTQQPDNKSLYPKLKNVDISTLDSACNDTGFEAIAAQYLKVFDDVITAVEEKPGDVQTACDRLSAVGKMHRTKVSGMDASGFQNMEEPFLFMVGDVLQDRFNEKAETLFRKFFQFCLKYLLEGFNK